MRLNVARKKLGKPISALTDQDYSELRRAATAAHSIYSKKCV